MDRQKKRLLEKAYRQFFEAGMNSISPRPLQEFIDGQVIGIGTAVDEKLRGIADVRRLLQHQYRQMKGLKIRWKKTRFSSSLTPDENTAVFADDVYLMIGTGKQEVKMYIRFSVVFHYNGHDWKVIHWHGSKPEEVKSEEDTYGVEQWKQKTVVLQQMVDQKTADLLQKNRELSIESALEKVRAVAMGMKERADMLDICKKIAQQLQVLGLREIRNVQTAIFQVPKGAYMNYEFYAKHNKTFITETLYTNHRVARAFAKKMLKGRGEVSITHIRGKQKVREWLRYQKGTNVFIDTYLNTAASLSYYWYSLGPVALGISTYQPLSPVDLKLFERFLKVFELAYQRYLDIEKAESQAREAQVEAALERVRSRSIGMQKSEELKAVIQTVYEQLVQLNIPVEHTGFILDYKKRKDFSSWIADHLGSPAHIVIPYFDTPYYNRFNEAKKKGHPFFAMNLDRAEKNKFYRDLFRHLPGFPKASRDFILRKPALTISTALLEDVALYIENFSGIPFSEEENELLIRFGKVFQQSYTRFLDLQKAEAQTREALIEGSLERVRAAAMAMRNSAEIGGLIHHLYSELIRLDARLDRCFIMIVDPASLAITWWLAGKEGLLSENGFIIPDNPYPSHRLYLDTWRKRAKKWSYLFEGKEKRDWDRFGFSKTELSQLPGFIKKDMAAVRKVYLSGSSDQFGCLVTGSLEPLSDDHQDIISRFSVVFNQTYTRFLDLKKAEEQAREAEIQLAMERVRARTMAMQRSAELREAANLLFQQMQALGLPAWSAGYGTWSKDENGKTKGVTLWMSSAGILQEPFYAPVDEDPSFRYFYEASLKDESFYVKEIGGDAIKTHYRYMRSLPVVGDMLNKFIAEGGSLPSYQIYHLVYFSHGFLLFITYEPVPEAHGIFKRFGNVFEQTYTRFLDLQKAEAQAREAQIEAALERVRSRTMGMQKSEELHEVSLELYQQLENLGEPAEQLTIGVINEEDKVFEISATLKGNKFRQTYAHSINEPIVMNKVYRGWKAKQKSLVLVQYAEELSAYNKWRNELVGKDMFPVQFSPDTRRTVQIAFFSRGMLALSTPDSRPKESIELLERFAGVFDLTYTRFLDLQRAEAQAREAQIETALERVRARALAMHNSDEFTDVAKVLREQMGALGQRELETSAVHLYTEDPAYILSWRAFRLSTDLESGITYGFFKIPKDSCEMAREFMARFGGDAPDYTIELSGRKQREWYKILFELAPEVRDAMVRTGTTREKRYYHLSRFTGGALLMVSSKQPATETIELQKRAAQVLDLAYRRFKDLQKAEAQAREAQVEAALERVRSQAMAMRQSTDLLDIVVTMRTEFTRLGHEAHYFWYMRWLPDKYEKAMTSGDGTRIGMIMSLPRHIHGDIPLVAGWEKTKEPSLVFAMDLDEAISYVDKMVALGDFERVDPQAPSHDDLRHINGLTFVMARTAHGEIGYSLPGVVENPPADDIHTLIRFAGVFDLAYSRFEDLKEAERRNRETQVELALERVRARTMAMQASHELQETAAVLFNEFKKLGTDNIYQVTIGIYNEEEQVIDFRVTSWADSGEQENRSFNLSMDEPTVLQPAIRAWKNGDKHHVIDLSGESLEQWLAFRNKMSGVHVRSEDTDGRRVISVAYFSKGHLSLSSPVPVPPETIKILERFANVFDGTYTRFQDLEKAEAQARESNIEAALERVRSKTLAMQRSDELADTAAVVFQQLILLGIEPNRLYIAIVKEDEEHSEFWITDEDGSRVSRAFETNLNDNITLKKMLQGWKRQEKSLVIDMQGEELQAYFAYLTRLGVPFKEGLSQHRRIQEIAYFSKGFIGMASPDEQSVETLQLLERFAAVFNLTFTRFNDLQIAEAHAVQAEQDLVAIREAKQKAEEALAELQSTQKQLIQSEKMASLGELTAGIAHEIQNPLNFVNNFSDVSRELLEEMRDAMEKGDTEDAKEIMQDVIMNLEKISHHGKRADGIVKGMLQHSRSGNGQMEPTDINALCDEYLRLAYHGLRAKDKSFNAKFETDFDGAMGKVNVLPQDLGRVILNLINNAFYAVTERKKTGEAGYEPRVLVSTVKKGSRIQINVRDNGIGIPPKVLDKIFQPFFTTKPTGQGTGLGLSLSYDIIKAHGGELKVETKEGEGTTFFIVLPGQEKAME